MKYEGQRNELEIYGDETGDIVALPYNPAPVDIFNPFESPYQTPPIYEETPGYYPANVKRILTEPKPAEFETAPVIQTMTGTTATPAPTAIRVIKIAPAANPTPATAPTTQTAAPAEAAEAASEQDLIFGYPSTYVYIGGAVAAVAALYLLSGSQKA